jgi:hypothetical protein
VKQRNDFLEQLERRRRETTKASEPSRVEKPVEEMSEAELVTALAEAKRELLEATRAAAEARKEESGVQGSEKPRFSQFIKKRPRWR